MIETHFDKDSEHRSKYDRLHRFELFAEDIIDTVHESLLVLESDFKIVFASQAFYKSFNAGRKETEGMFLFDLGDGQWNIPLLHEALKKLVIQNAVLENFEVEHDFKQLGKRIMHVSARRLTGEKGPDTFILLSIKDVTQRVSLERNLQEYKTHLEELIAYRSQNLKELNKKLAEEKERLNITLRSIADAVITTDIEGKITLMNHAAETFMGLSQKDALGKPLSQVLNIMDQKTCQQLTQLAERIVQSKGFIPVGRDLILVARGGRERIIAATGSPIRDMDGRITGVVFVFRDITEEKKMEDKLRQSHKMESIGTLAGGIAHDFNNILFAIMGHTDLAMLELSDDSAVLPSLKEIYKACNRAKDLVQQILTFSRQTKQVFKPVAVSSVIEEAMKLIRASVPSSIKIDLNINSDSKIIADATQIYQVIYNLCTNAAQAIQDEMGFIQVSLSDTEIDNDFSLLHPELKPGKYVKLSVVDSGYGISSEIKDKIFDPYFTTKQLGKGTGMGLSVVLGIITNHNGRISVSSEPGKGTVFDVYFPVIERKKSQSAGIEIFEPMPTGNERILLVDDEEQIVQLERQMLEKLGYTVTTQTSSKKALEIFRRGPYEFDLVITDLTMPEMTGYHLAQRMRKIRSDVPIIVCSGYAEYLSDERIQQIGISAFVLKPLTMVDLSKITRKILDRKIFERRQNERFRIKEKAVVIPKSDQVTECEIVDISWGGLAICFFSLQRGCKHFDELAIKLIEKSIVLDRVPCKIISDFDLTNAPHETSDVIKKRQGIQFGKLEYNQLKILDHLIHNYTVASA